MKNAEKRIIEEIIYECERPEYGKEYSGLTAECPFSESKSDQKLKSTMLKLVGKRGAIVLTDRANKLIVGVSEGSGMFDGRIYAEWRSPVMETEGRNQADVLSEKIRLLEMQKPSGVCSAIKRTELLRFFHSMLDSVRECQKTDYNGEH